MTTRDQWPAALPATHADFLERAVGILSETNELVGIAAGGSFISGEMDEQSDLDLVLVCDPGTWPGVLERRREIAAGLGPLLAAFTGEHVNEPRLLICLYGPPLLHVDLKFVSLDDAHVRVEDPVILWEAEGAVATAFARGPARYPHPDLEWIEDRFWIWAHFLADKIKRGELFHAIEMLTFLRARVLGPLALVAGGATPDGVRRIETAVPEFAGPLRGTVPVYDADSCLGALRATIDLYSELRAAEPRPSGTAATDESNSDAERAVRAHVATLSDRLGQARSRGG